jgi:phosphoribosylformylglycinamidine cyclo-ligase (EC 6.3.3.1)
MTDDEPMSYAAAGVDIGASEDATAALVSAVTSDIGGYAGTVPIGDRVLGLVTDGVGTKLLVAQAMDRYDTIGIDCVAMNVNDLVAAGLRPVAFVDYLAVETPDPAVAAAIGRGLEQGVTTAGIPLIGGETAVMPEVIADLDIAGTAAGVAPPDALFDAGAAPGDVLVGFPATGVHANGLTLARKALARRYALTDPAPYDQSVSIGEELLRPTAIYTGLYEALQAVDVHAAAHITGGGWRNLFRMGADGFRITQRPSPPAIFEIIQRAGAITDAEMFRTFNMGVGFVVAVPPAAATQLTTATDGQELGTVEADGGVMIQDIGIALSS